MRCSVSKNSENNKDKRIVEVNFTNGKVDKNIGIIILEDPKTDLIYVAILNHRKLYPAIDDYDSDISVI